MPSSRHPVGVPAATPISSWFEDESVGELFRRRCLGRKSITFPPRDDDWKSVVPDFRGSLALAESGCPFQVVVDRRYDRSGDPRRLNRALAEGRTVFLPQVHQVLPRLMRLMIALRAAFLGPFREECSYLFLVEGKGRPGMGLHHDGEVDSFWLQLEGQRTVTIGPPVPPGTPEDLDDRLAPRESVGGWWTDDLEPGTLFYMPPRTPHRVVCHGRSLALSLTWGAFQSQDAVGAFVDLLGPSRLSGSAGASLPAFRRLLEESLRSTADAAKMPVAPARLHAAGLTAWDGAAGRIERKARRDPNRLWTQIPAVVSPIDQERGEILLWTSGGGEVRIPAAGRPIASQLAMMPSFRRADVLAAGAKASRLIEQGILAPRDLPLRVIPEDPAVLDGWQFA